MRGLFETDSVRVKTRDWGGAPAPQIVVQNVSDKMGPPHMCHFSYWLRRVRSQTTPCGICGGASGNGK